MAAATPYSARRSSRSAPTGSRRSLRNRPTSTTDAKSRGSASARSRPAPGCRRRPRRERQRACGAVPGDREVRQPKGRAQERRPVGAGSPIEESAVWRTATTMRFNAPPPGSGRVQPPPQSPDGALSSAAGSADAEFILGHRRRAGCPVFGVVRGPCRATPVRGRVVLLTLESLASGQSGVAQPPGRSRPRS